MSGQSSERTEQPTARRLRKAREDGRVPRSTEVTAAALTLAALLVFWMSGAWWMRRMAAAMKAGLQWDVKLLIQPEQALARWGEQWAQGWVTLLPLLLVCAVVAVVAGQATGGFLFRPQAVLPKGDKLDLLQGLQRLFGPRAWMELGKTLLKFVVVAGTLVVVLVQYRADWAQVGRMGLEAGLLTTGRLALECTLWVSLALVGIAALDVPLQRWQYLKGLRMSKQEIKDEMKESEGQPEVRAQIRRRQRELAMAKMMQRLPEADVVITNPDHFAVALAYNPSSDAPPVVIAKGVDHLALRIRGEAARQGVMVFEAPPLARALYFTTELEHPVPEALYFAVAQVIAYVFGLADVQPGVPPPIRPQPRVPASMAFDTQGQRMAPAGSTA